MTEEELLTALRFTLDSPIPLPAGGQTALRHMRLMDVGRQNLAVARLAEAHWDAVAILSEADRKPEPGVIYGVWASEGPKHTVKLASGEDGLTISGAKMFCSGAGLIDRVLLTVTVPEQLLLDIDLRTKAGTIQFDYSGWKTHAFLETRTAMAIFTGFPVSAEQIVRGAGWYLTRPGFWHGACGPAACWAGGAAGLVDYALGQSRHDPHTLAHLGAMQASVWALRSYLNTAGREIDERPDQQLEARTLALTVRHLVEQACTDVLRRLARAYGPYPLAMEAQVSDRYQELDLYLRQCHAERDLEALGRDFRQQQSSAELLLTSPA